MAKIYMDSENSITSIEIKKMGIKNDRSPDCLKDHFFCNLQNWIIMQNMFLTSLIWLIFSDFCYIAKY